MYWNEYVRQAVERSGAYDLGEPGSPKRFAYLTLGLCGETSELAFTPSWDAAKVLEECGDCAWYLAMLCVECDPDTIFAGLFAELPRPERGGPNSGAQWALEIMHAHAGGIAEQAKRALTGRAFDHEKWVFAMQNYAYGLREFCRSRSTTIEAVCDESVAKNLRRFGANPSGVRHD